MLIGTLLGGGYSCGDGDGQDLTSEWNKISVHAQWINSIIRGEVLFSENIFWLLNLYRSFRGLKIGCYVFQALLQKIPLNFRLLIFLQYLLLLFLHLKTTKVRGFTDLQVINKLNDRPV